MNYFESIWVIFSTLGKIEKIVGNLAKSTLFTKLPTISAKIVGLFKYSKIDRIQDFQSQMDFPKNS